MRHLLFVGLILCLPTGSIAQDRDQTLADIRQQLTVLYVDIQRLRTELSTTGSLGTGTVGNTPLDRLNAIEAELQRLTSKTEELEFRVNRITVDGTNRIGDLEFRLCELEPQCDIALLGDTPSLGGVDNGATVPVATPSPDTGGPSLAVGEQQDFERAQNALAAEDFQTAADLLVNFSASYPGSPLTADAAFLRGRAFEGLGQMTQAARGYLDSFSSDSTGPTAPQALFLLGSTLAAIGQTQDACLTLAEVGVRFPGDTFVQLAGQKMSQLGCS